ncbi:hypothetical protein [Bowmanella denitrificans]|uniref:hypothetical protein n=1 Tax=Bowmanella denitrificans TaxID=366582 RepID=UPI000C9CC6F7|nr:hypothetical protein [Bowmanella denitrificans]
MLNKYVLLLILTLSILKQEKAFSAIDSNVDFDLYSRVMSQCKILNYDVRSTGWPIGRAGYQPTQDTMSDQSSDYRKRLRQIVGDKSIAWYIQENRFDARNPVESEIICFPLIESYNRSGVPSGNTDASRIGLDFKYFWYDEKYYTQQEFEATGYVSQCSAGLVDMSLGGEVYKEYPMNLTKIQDYDYGFQPFVPDGRLKPVVSQIAVYAPTQENAEDLFLELGNNAMLRLFSKCTVDNRNHSSYLIMRSPGFRFIRSDHFY